MKETVIILIVAIGIFLLYKAITNKKVSNDKIDNKEEKPNKVEMYLYRKKALLTQNELKFYTNLKQIIENYNVVILTKIRLADIVEPLENPNYKEWQASFNKIKSKHIDFAIADPKTLEIITLIELDDSTHGYKKRVNRDIFVNELFKKLQLPLLRVYSANNIETKLSPYLSGYQHLQKVNAETIKK